MITHDFAQVRIDVKCENPIDGNGAYMGGSGCVKVERVPGDRRKTQVTFAGDESWNLRKGQRMVLPVPYAAFRKAMKAATVTLCDLPHVDVRLEMGWNKVEPRPAASF